MLTKPVIIKAGLYDLDNIQLALIYRRKLCLQHTFENDVFVKNCMS